MDCSDPISQKEAIAKAIEAIKEHRCLRFSGPCGSGKTTLCKKILANENLAKDLREGRAFMLTSRRPVADELSLEIAQGQPYLQDSRPVKTANALAFWILKRANPYVRLLDVTSQTKLITEVIKSHIKHVEEGNECEVCNELERYINLVSSDLKGTTRARAFEKVFLPVGFITRLREAFARFDELGIGLEKGALQPYEESLRSYEGADDSGHGRLSWNLVQSLRREYAYKVRNSKDYGDNFFDNSSMLNSAALEVKKGNGDLPKVVIVDDCQDLNLAAYDLLKEMHNKNVPVIFVGNDDESVQGYKGAMPDVLSILEEGEDFNCALYRIVGKDGIEGLSKSKFLRGISNNIGSWFIGNAPIPDRAGKPNGDISENEDYFEYRKANSEEEELDQLIHEISDYMLEPKGAGKDKGSKPHWRDLAVISNENAFLHSVGERLKANRIPFKYTSVNEEPIKNSLVVQAMLSFMKLAYYASLGEKACEQPGNEEVSSLIKDVIASPLFQVEYKSSANNFEIASRIFVSVLNVLNYGTEEKKAEFSEFKSWEEWRGEKDKDLNSFFIFLLTNPEARKKILGKVKEENPEEDKASSKDKDKYPDALKSRTVSLMHLFVSVDKAKADIGNVSQLFWDLWNESFWVKEGGENDPEGEKWEKKSRPELWQQLALESGEISSSINEWLDHLIRLQHLAQIGPDGETVPEFIQRVSGSSIDSDSLAHVAPKDEAVTLSSPVGVESERFVRVWIPDAQEDVWNKSLMEDLFSTHLLEALVTDERVKKASPGSMPEERAIQDRFLEEETHSNLRSLLVASSRSNGKTVFLAVEDEDHTPLFRLSALEGVKEEVGSSGSEDGTLDERNGKGADFEDRILKDLKLRSSSLSGMSDYCRAVLAKAISINEGDSDKAKDAACSLKLLSTQIESANPASWSFMQKPDAQEFIQTGSGTIYLSPSRVDNLWSTPVNSILQDSRYIGPTKSGSRMQFGTAIHACAQWATEQGLDQLKGICIDSSEMAVKQAIDEVKEKLIDKFEAEAAANVDWSPLEKGDYRRKAGKAMENLATYFVNTLKPSGTEGPLSNMPDLVKATPEKWINSIFTLKDILRLVRGTKAFQDIDISESDLIEALEKLGKFEGLNDVKDKTISISGQIDRFEERDGGINYVIDYKTGQSYCNKFKDFSDLQLLCYQLLLYFPGETKNSGDAEKIHWGGGVFADKSMLFSIEKEPYPATAKAKDDTTYTCGGGKNKRSTYERYFQPCIFNKEGGLNDGSLNEFQRKVGSEVSLIEKKDIPDSSNPILQVLKKLTPADKKQECINLLPWVFYMLSKFFYVVRYVDSAHFELREEEDVNYKNSEERDRIEETMTIYGMGR